MKSGTSVKMGTTFNKRTIPKTLLSIVSVTMGLVLGDQVKASTKISSCPFVIAKPGVYTVARDIICSGTAISILADNVDLHLGGHTISGNGSGDGIFVQGG